MALGDNCSSACVTRDHATFGECMRAKSIRSQWLGGTGPSARDQRRFEADTETYRQVVRDGGSMSVAMRHGAEEAYRRIGRA